MNDYSTSGAITMSGTTWSVLPSQGSRPEKPPKGLITTKAVQVADGWLGQVFVDSEIVWESDYYEESDSAIDIANRVIIKAFTDLILAAGNSIDE